MGICASKLSLPVNQSNDIPPGLSPQTRLVMKQRPANFMSTGRRANRIYLSDYQEPSMRRVQASGIPKTISVERIGNTASHDDSLSVYSGISYSSASSEMEAQSTAAR
jgi:hypothetical protein